MIDYRCEPCRDDEFIHRVQLIARAIGPAAPIAGIYDQYGVLYAEYGVLYGDAGSLTAFKARLVAAAKGRHLRLGRCDLPEEMLDRETYKRSKTKWGADVVHYVLAA